MSPVAASGWVIVGVVAWVLLAAVAAVLIGRMLRLRDRQVPRAEAPVAPSTGHSV